jgi:hypothetical protein
MIDADRHEDMSLRWRARLLAMAAEDRLSFWRPCWALLIASLLYVILGLLCPCSCNRWLFN